MVATVWSNITDNTQTAIYNCLSTFQRILSNYTTSVLDGFATDTIRKQGFFIRVNTPTISEQKLCLNRYKEATVTCEIEILGKPAGQVRKCADEVRYALELAAADGTFGAQNLVRMKIDSTAIGATELPGAIGYDLIHFCTVSVQFYWRGP